jgi:hypothetical protein
LRGWPFFFTFFETRVYDVRLELDKLMCR